MKTSYLSWNRLGEALLAGAPGGTRFQLMDPLLELGPFRRGGGGQVPAHFADRFGPPPQVGEHLGHLQMGPGDIHGRFPPVTKSLVKTAELGEADPEQVAGLGGAGIRFEGLPGGGGRIRKLAQIGEDETEVHSID